jgi:hypothetical protein
MWRSPRSTLVAAIALTACGGDDTAPAASGGAGGDAGQGGSGGESLCGDGEVPAADGGCLIPGVPADACGAGFEPDGANGCEPVLPSTDCGRGSFAVPGQTECHPVGTCLDRSWTGIGVDDTTEFVDAAYAGAESDGTIAKPWTTISDAVAAAAPGAIVAIAAGSYAEDVDITGKPVRLWGRCPAMVEVSGSAYPSAVVIRQGAAGSELRNLSITGEATGVFVSAADVVLDSVWIHDTALQGLVVSDELAETSATIDKSLIENAAVGGVLSMGGSLDVLSSSVRDAHAASDGVEGRGIGAVRSPFTGDRARLSIVGSVIERNEDIGVAVHGSVARVEATLIQDTLPQQVDLKAGRGINVQPIGFTNMPSAIGSEVVVIGSVLRRNTEIGMYLIGSDVTVEATVVRDTLPQAADSSHGRGIECGGALLARDLFRGAVSIRSSLVTQSREVGLFVSDTELTLHATRIESTLAAGDDGALGDGLAVYGGEVQTMVRVESSWIEQSARAGVGCFGADVQMTGSRLECNAIDLDGEPLAGTPYEIIDLGQNRCSCGGVEQTCVVKTTSLTPPEPLGDD